MLVSRVRDAFTESGDAGEDFVGGLGPDERLWVFVIDVQVLADGALQLEGAAMGAAFDLASADQGEPALDKVEPGARSGREVHVKSRMTSEPTFDRGGLVRAVVVQDQMHVQLSGDVGFDRAQERKELLAAMTSMQLSDHAPRGDIQRREQTRRAVALVVMGAPLGQARGKRQDRLGAIQGLDLALLIHAQHHRLGRRIQIQADEVAHLVDKQRIGRELESLGTVRLQPKGTPSAAHRALRDLKLLRKQARAPMRGLARALIERSGDQLLDSRLIELARRTGPRLIEQAVEPPLKKATAPLAHGLTHDATALGYLAVVRPLCARQDDVRTQGQILRGLMPPRPFDQLIVLLHRQLQLLELRSPAHRSLSVCSPYPETHGRTKCSLIKDSIH